VNPLLDVTRALVEGHPNWPGDAPLTLTPSALIARGDSVNVHTLATSLHGGTHVDAPWHTDDRGGRIESVDLRRLIGAAVVLDVSGGEGAVTVAEVEAALADLDAGAPLPPRVLLHTGEADDWGRTFPVGFRPLEPATVAWLAERGVLTIGTDAPSVDAFDSKRLPTHAACRAHDVVIVEGLALARVAPGRYRLLCLPLALRGVDGAPVRALLEPLG
jgi:arylformamidase